MPVVGKEAWVVWRDVFEVALRVGMAKGYSGAEGADQIQMDI